MDHAGMSLASWWRWVMLVVGDLKNTCVDPRLEAGPPSSTAPYILSLKTDQSFILSCNFSVIFQLSISYFFKSFPLPPHTSPLWKRTNLLSLLNVIPSIIVRLYCSFKFSSASDICNFLQKKKVKLFWKTKMVETPIFILAEKPEMFDFKRSDLIFEYFLIWFVKLFWFHLWSNLIFESFCEIIVKHQLIISCVGTCPITLHQYHCQGKVNLTICKGFLMNSNFVYQAASVHIFSICSYDHSLHMFRL